MRFNVEIILEKENIPKDKNRMILSYLKHVFQSYDDNFYKSLYEKEINKLKGFTFSLYMPNCKFTREEIIIPEKKIILNFSSNDMQEGIMFYNAILSNVGKGYPFKENNMTAKNINMVREKNIVDQSVIFKSMSPIVIREHNGDNKKTWYYSFDEEKGCEIFLNNLKYQLINEFGDERILDINELRFEVLRNKVTKVKNYSIVIPTNISVIKIYAKTYILDYIYKSGVGSKRNSGFGMVDIY